MPRSLMESLFLKFPNQNFITISFLLHAFYMSSLLMFCDLFTLPQSVQRLSYELNDRDSIPVLCSDGIFFSPPPRPDRLWDPSSLISNWYWEIFTSEVKRSGREADHSLSSSANAWNYTSTPPINLHGVGLN
jgi:hypothetical protein